jgi:sortase family protein
LTGRRWRVRWPVAALIVGLALAGGSAVGYAVTRPPGHDYGAVPPPGSYHAGTGSQGVTVARPAASGGGGTAAQPAAAPKVAAVQVPVRLLIPAIGVSAPVLPTGVQAGGSLAIPPDPSDVGWWAGGGFPGEPAGAVILVGHINSAALGPGALLRLQDLRPGMVITVMASGQAYRYRVVALRAYAKASLPVAAVFGQQVAPRLVVVSCGGPFDASTGHYLDNIVAYAVPSGTAP